MNLQLLATLLGQLAIIASDPALGYRGAALLQILNLISTAITIGDEARSALESLQAKVQLMVEANREPTKDEWAELRALAKFNHELLVPPIVEPVEAPAE